MVKKSLQPLQVFPFSSSKKTGGELQEQEKKRKHDSQSTRQMLMFGRKRSPVTLSGANLIPA